MSIYKYRKAPVEIEAGQFRDWSTAIKIMDWADGVYYVFRGYEHALRLPHEFDKGNGHVLENAPAYLVVKTLAGSMRASINDFIIKGVQGEFYPCKPDIFDQTSEDILDE